MESQRNTKLAGNKIAVHFSSTTDLWETPQNFFDVLDAEFGFTLDVCALPSNAKCKRYFSPEDNGLLQEWTGICFMNCPYGKFIKSWVRKAAESARQGATVVCLLPARTDTTWWHEFIEGQADIRFIRGRLKFGGGRHSAPFPSVVVIFRPLEQPPFVAEASASFASVPIPQQKTSLNE